jgi:hypothetical protein
MAAPSSLTARQAIGIQADKTTAATTYTGGVMTRSALNPEFDTIDPIAEHYGGTNTRATVRKSVSDRPSYIMRAQGRQRMKPELFGILLRGAGFGVVSTGTGVKSHAFTIANRDLAAYLTIMEKMGEGAGAWEHKAIGCRVNSITVSTSRQEVALEYTASGLSEVVSLGTEPVTNEPMVNIVPTTGTLSLLIGGVALFSKYFGSELTISNPLVEDEIAMHTALRDDIAPQGLDISGTFNGIEFDKDVYKKLNWGGTAGLAPSVIAPVGVLTYTYESAAVIAGQAAPYSFTVSVPVAEVQPISFVAEDDNLIRGDISWRMIDSVATPITITLANTKTGY